mgnify:FL=1
MGKKNASARRRLERIYGKVDMFTKAEVEKELEKLNIKGYKTFEEEKRLKGQPISQQLTFHHLKHRSEGGDYSTANGALIGLTRHEYMHSLSREEEEIANDIIRNWKVNFLIMNGKGEVSNSGTIKSDFSDCITIPIHRKKKKILNEQYKKYIHPSRAKLKEELHNIIKEEFEK